MDTHSDPIFSQIEDCEEGIAAEPARVLERREGQAQKEGRQRAEETGLRLLLVPERPEERHHRPGDYDAQGQDQGKYTRLNFPPHAVAGPASYRAKHHQLRFELISALADD